MLDMHVASKEEATWVRTAGERTNHTWQPAFFREGTEMGKVQGQVEKEEARAELVMELPK